MSSIPNGRPRPNTGNGETMRATVYNGIPFRVDVESLPKPKLLASEDAIVRITSAGICGSDLHIFRGFFGSQNPPWALGHEGIGIVQEVGEAVQSVKPGDRVILGAPTDGQFHIKAVPELSFPGLGPDFFHGRPDGLQAEYARVAQADTSLIPIPHYPARELDYLMCSDIWATAWTCLDVSGFQPGESVAVFGAGPVGLLCAHTALFRGASRVYIVDHVKSRLAKAKEFGAIPIDFTKGNAAKQILKFEEVGVDRSCDCCGYECLNEKLEPQQNAIINDMVSVTIPGGGIGVIGAYLAQEKAPGRPNADQISPTIDFPMTAFWTKQLTIKAATVNPQALAPQLVQLIKSGRAHPGRIVSKIIGIEEVREGFKGFNKHLETKVVIRFPWMHDEWKVGNASGVEDSTWNGDGPRKTSFKSLEDIEAEI